MTQLSPDLAKRFFTSLYKEAPAHLQNFDAVSTKLVSSLGGTVNTGDQALQSLMFNYILSSPENIASGKKLIAAVANIKQASVTAFTEAFPDANLDTLISQAKAAGYQVEVLKH